MVLAFAVATSPAAGQVVASAQRPATDKAAVAAAQAVEAAENKQLGSLYLRCDGQPNNMTGAESFARFLGAVSLLAVLAPAAESPDSSKRLFAEKGVAACSRLIEPGEKSENNALRRVPLILARALHHIEAKDYSAALADVAKSRQEAAALGLPGNPYFDRSMGLSFDLIEAEARLRNGDAAGAREVGLRNAARMPMSMYAAIAARPFGEANRSVADEELAFYRASQKVNYRSMGAFTARLEEAGHFSEAAAQREAAIQIIDALILDKRDSAVLAYAAIDHALAGNWTMAERRAQESRANMEKLIAAGQPESERPRIVELLDLYDILVLARVGKVDDARRNFAARSAWTAPNFGAVLAITTRLRQGARPDQLFGSLAKTSEELWEARRLQLLAQRLEFDTNNRTLFTYILPYASIKNYEAASKSVWKTTKSWMLSAEPMKNSRFFNLGFSGDAMTQPDAMLLHAANQAKVRGAKGFVFLVLPSTPDRALVLFGNPGDPGIPEALFLDAESVIGEQRQLIPSPAELVERRKPRRT